MVIGAKRPVIPTVRRGVPVDPGAEAAAGDGGVVEVVDAAEMARVRAMSHHRPRASNNRASNHRASAKRPNLQNDAMTRAARNQKRPGNLRRQYRGKKTRKLNNSCQNSSTTSWVQWALSPIRMSVTTTKTVRLCLKSKARTQDC